MGEIIREAYQNFATGNIPAVIAAFDASISWHVPGHGPLSGDYSGLDQIGGFFQHAMDLSVGAFSIDVHHVLADRDLAVSLVTVNGERNGVAASFPEVHILRLKNGKVTEFREYQGDAQREDQFWSCVSRPHEKATEALHPEEKSPSCAARAGPLRLRSLERQATA